MGEDLLLAAKRHELGGLQKNRIMLSRLSALDILLNDVYAIHRPHSQDYDSRRDLVRIFNEIARELYGNNDNCPVVEEFGSFVMDMFNAGSDLDLSINFSDKKVVDDRSERIKALRKFAKKCYILQKKGSVRNVQQILSARVPVLKVTDCGTGIECDISVGNLDGIAKSQIVLMISAIDERFQKLSFLMKAWAKAHDINSSKDGTLNSISLILLAAFHLQTRDTPILPPFSAILQDGTDPVAVKKCVPRFYNYGKGNQESLAELFVSLLVKLESVEALWPEGLCASTYEGSWIQKDWRLKRGCIGIEDFTDRSQNASRAVKSKLMGKIYSCIHRSLEHISIFTEGNMDAGKLKNLLFGAVPVTTNEVSTDVFLHTPLQPVLPNPSKRKRKRKQSALGGPTESQRQTGKPDKNLPNSQGGKSHRLPNFPPTQPERFHFETFSRVTPHVHNPQYFSDMSFQGSWAGQPRSFPNMPIQGSGGFGHERAPFNHAASNYPTPFPYSLPPRSGSVMPPHLPHLSSTSRTDHMWSRRPYEPHPTYPLVPAQFANASRAPSNRESLGNQLPQPHRYQSYFPFHNFN